MQTEIAKVINIQELQILHHQKNLKVQKNISQQTEETVSMRNHRYDKYSLKDLGVLRKTVTSQSVAAPKNATWNLKQGGSDTLTDCSTAEVW